MNCFNRLTSIIKLLVTAAVLIASVALPNAARATSRPHLTSAESTAVSNCQTLIRNRYLTFGTPPQGAFQMATNNADNSVWIQQYFALEAVIALMAAGPSTQDLQEIGAYLTFYATDAQNEPQGVAHNYGGQLGSIAPLSPTPQNLSADYDSIDSYAGLFLLACARYYKITGSLPPQAQTGLTVSLCALNKVINEKTSVSTSFSFSPAALDNGLSISRDISPVSFLLDNVEAYAGLHESVGLFQSLGMTSQATKAQTLANGIFEGTELFEQDGQWAYLVDNGNSPQIYTNPQVNPATDPVAREDNLLPNLFAISYLPIRYFPDLYNNLKSTYLIDNAQEMDDQAIPSACPSERWLIAATRISSGDVAALRATVVQNVNGSESIAAFGPDTYIDRPAMSLIALLGGSANYASLVGPTTMTIDPVTPNPIAPSAFTQITGTVTAGSATVSQMAVALYYVNGGVDTYWTGTGFSTTLTLLPTTVTGNTWTAIVGNPLPKDQDYAIRAYAVANDGQTSGAVYSSVLIKTPFVAPSLTVNPVTPSPIAPSAFTQITGTVTRGSATVSQVGVALYYVNAGADTYWTGTGFTTSLTLLPTTITGGTWTASVGNAVTFDKTYSIRAFAQDANGYQTGAVYSSVVVKTPFLAPSLTINPVTPSPIAPSAFSQISGTVTRGSAAVTQVGVALYYINAGADTYWTGSGFSTTPTLLPTTITGGAWTASVGSPVSRDAAYGIRVYAEDANGYVSAPVYSSVLVVTGATGHAIRGGNGLSAAAVNTATRTIVLEFVGQLDAKEATRVNHYAVSINGELVAIEGVVYGNGLAVLTLPENSLRKGDRATAAWIGLRDAKGDMLNGQSGAMTAR